MTTKQFTIGTLAKRAGVTVETIRFYQRRGLLTEPAKQPHGVRRYTERDVQRVRFIKQGQLLGFSLDEMGELLSLEDGRHCREAQAVAVNKLASIRQRMESLRAMEQTLAGLVERCSRNSGEVSCPIIDALQPPPSGERLVL